MKSLIVIIVLVSGAHILKAAESKVDFAKDIQPLLQQQCFKCHGEEKQKGKLRLDSKEAALKGGKNGPAYVAGDAAKSELFRRVSLPKTDDDFMPSEGEPLTNAQLDLVKEWINQGGTWPDGALVKSSAPAAPKGPPLPADFKPSAAETKAIAALGQKGVDVRPIAANLNWREANFRLQGTNVNDALLAPAKDILGLVDLNLATTRVTDAGLANLKGLTNLQRLHLELTGIGDAGLAQVKGLPNLTYLNLYGTKVTDAGLENLKGMKHLRNLYVWQSKVTEDGAKKFKASMPSVDVSTGWDLAAFAKIKEEREAKEKEAKEKEAKEKAAKEKETKEKETKKAEEAKKAEEKKAEEKKAEKKEDKSAEKKPDEKADNKEEKKQ